MAFPQGRTLLEALKMQNATIDFQLPAVLCYQTIQMHAVMSAADLTKIVDSMLKDCTRPLIKPDDISTDNWKLVNDLGNTIILEQWKAMPYDGNTIMVTFDRRYNKGRLCVSPWKIINSSDFLRSLGQGVTPDEKVLFGLSHEYCVVRVQYYRPSSGKKPWTTDGKPIIILAHRRHRVAELPTALKSGQNVEVRYSFGKTQDAMKMIPSNAPDALASLDIGGVVELDFLLR